MDIPVAFQLPRFTAISSRLIVTAFPSNRLDIMGKTVVFRPGMREIRSNFPVHSRLHGKSRYELTSNMAVPIQKTTTGDVGPPRVNYRARGDANKGIPFSDYA